MLANLITLFQNGLASTWNGVREIQNDPTSDTALAVLVTMSPEVGMAVESTSMAVEPLVSSTFARVSSWAKNLFSSRSSAPSKPGDYVRSNQNPVQRTLPKDSHGVMQPDSQYPHSQLGRSTKSHGAQPQAVEWNYDGQGRLVPQRQIDFTDHNFPGNHVDPHQHTLTPVNPDNPLGGGFTRGAAESL